MPNPRISAAWLSSDMALALAAMCPPLDTTDVEQALLERRQVQVACPGPHGPIEDVDLEVAELDHWRERDSFAIGPPEHRHDPRQELFGRKWDRQNIVGAPLERG